ncbi:MAG: hypothetical protein ACREN7_02675 [Candidatus Dormibacteria bacterium]
MSSEAGIELHLVSRLGDRRAWSHCRARAEAGARVEVVLLQDAVLEQGLETAVAAWEGGPGREMVVLACAADAMRRGVEERWALIDYAAIIDRCAVASRVVSW